MPTNIQKNNYSPTDSLEKTIVVGSGPAGVRFVTELLSREPLAHVQLFGNEPCEPYNRVQLSSVLAGTIDRSKIDIRLPSIKEHPNFNFKISRVNTIDTENHSIVDADGKTFGYSNLVLALGARAHVPNIPGVDQAGVYTFRNLTDTEALYSRVSSARHIVVVGGGLLGIEAARGLLRFNTKVTLIQQASRLMNRQLDESASGLLKKKVESLGIRVIVNSGVREIFGETRVKGVKTLDETIIGCDTVLLCAGIKPNIELARESGIKVGKGVVVDDHLRSSFDNIYAIGECSEHKGQTHGLVNPGYEQAAVLARNVAMHIGNAIGETDFNGEMNEKLSEYHGSISVSRLKVLDEMICSMGQIADFARNPRLKEIEYSNNDNGIYRKVCVLHGHIIGALAIGEWSESNRVQEAFHSERKLWFWNYWFFKFTGRLWKDEDVNVVQWPESSLVCQCNAVTQGTLVNAISKGCSNVKSLQDETGAGTVCGSCKPLLSELFGVKAPIEKVTGSNLLLLGAVVAVVVSAIIFIIPGAQTSDSVLSISWFEKLWNDSFFKKVTGFSLLGITCVGLLMSLRKRFNSAWLGSFSNWRLVHSSVGAFSLLLLIFHTGFHTGENLNRLLLLNFVGIAVVGASAASVISLGHRLNPIRARSLIKTWNFLHIIFTWPLPVLIAIHILTVYYF